MNVIYIDNIFSNKTIIERFWNNILNLNKTEKQQIHTLSEKFQILILKIEVVHMEKVTNRALFTHRHCTGYLYTGYLY